MSSSQVISLTDIPNFRSRAEEFFPIEWYKEMHQNHPVYYHEGTDTWNVFKYEDVKQVLSNYEYFSSAGERTTLFVGAAEKKEQESSIRTLVEIDPPDHRKIRSLLSAAFTPRSLKDWEPRIREIAAQLVGKIQDDSVNIVTALSAPFPGMVIADLFGVPMEDQAQFKKWVDTLFLPYDEKNLAKIEKMKKIAHKEYYEYLLPFVIQKRKVPKEDIISDLIRAEVDGEKLTDDDIVQASMVLLGAGVETTSNAIANTFYSLLYDDSSIYGQLKSQPELIPNAIEEMLRYRFQISKRHRNVKKDNDLLGVHLKKGDVVIAWISAANMDENMFENPYSLDIQRPNSKKQLSFGTGPHFCLGAPLARLEMKILLETFLEKFSGIEPDGDFDLEQNLTASAVGQTLTNLPIKLIR